MKNLVKNQKLKNTVDQYTSRPVHKSNIVDSEVEEDYDYFCIICLGAYSKSRKGEDWVECCSCKKWAHDKCAGAGGLLFYNCKNCSSDLDEDFEDTEQFKSPLCYVYDC